MTQIKLHRLRRYNNTYPQLLQLHWATASGQMQQQLCCLCLSISRGPCRRRCLASVTRGRGQGGSGGGSGGGRGCQRPTMRHLISALADDCKTNIIGQSASKLETSVVSASYNIGLC